MRLFVAIDFNELKNYSRKKRTSRLTSLWQESSFLWTKNHLLKLLKALKLKIEK